MGNEQLSDLADVIQRGYCLNVTHLNLTGNNFDDQGITILVHAIVENDSLPHLVDLNLDRTPIGDDGVEALCRTHHNCNLMGRLTHLSLRMTSLGDRACLALSNAFLRLEGKQMMIQQLQIDGNKGITPSGAACIRELQSTCPKLKNLWV